MNPIWKLSILVIVSCILLVYVKYSNRMTFPPTLFINLAKRKDRLKEIQEEFAGWTVPLERVEAVERKPGILGCNLSHYKCIQLAVERNYDWVLILEDDATLQPGGKEHFTKLLPYLWKTRNDGIWDMFIGGSTYIENERVLNKELKLFQMSGLTTHFVLIHKEACKKILRSLASLPIDKEGFFIDKYYKYNTKQITSIPFLSLQRPGVTDIQDSESDYTAYFKRAEKKLERLLHLLLSP
jgi:glycosyl transferase family 25